MTEWWAFQDSVLINSIGGGLLGAAGGLLGAAAGVLAPRGRCKALVLGAFGVMVTLGVCAMGAGVIALVGGQPHHVWYPLLLLGGIMSVVLGGLLPVVAVRYRQAEARRMDAEELRRS